MADLRKGISVDVDEDLIMMPRLSYGIQLCH